MAHLTPQRPPRAGVCISTVAQTAPYFDPATETLDQHGLRALQRHRLTALLQHVAQSNPFYRGKLGRVAFDPASTPLTDLPFTTRSELEQDQVSHPPFGTNLTYPVDAYCRFHQTSGSSGRPMRWLDTPQSWDWFRRCWATIFTAAGVTASDRALFPFSFGPFVGFWAAFEGAARLGILSIPAGGLSTTARLRMILDNQVTVICSTPTYALRMAEVAAGEGVDLASSSVKTLIVAGEPGGSIPETRRRIETAWRARVFDHTGMTEVGAMSFECAQRPGEGVHVIETEFIPEVIDPQTGELVVEQEPGRPVEGELVLTNLGRVGSPLIRYRTGDLVRLSRGRCACGRSFARLEGGILGRIDDMFIVRGNNVFPPAVEAVIRRFPEVAEFRVNILAGGALARVKVELEAGPGCPDEDRHALPGRVGRALQEALNFKAEVVLVDAGALPRFEMKAKRFIRQAT